ncbi:MAG TPA: hypothetical protein VJP60_02950, partial [Rhizomicrobium sp.]|nr:hypothetical protein [Rhizomicrobium sp.]
NIHSRRKKADSGGVSGYASLTGTTARRHRPQPGIVRGRSNSPAAKKFSPRIAGAVIPSPFGAFLLTGMHNGRKRVPPQSSP